MNSNTPQPMLLGGDALPAEHYKDEAHRISVLRSYNILDTQAEEAFDRITRIASDLFDTPIALISMIDERRQWFKSRLGVEFRETPRDWSFCAHAIEGDEVMVVPDAQLDDRFKDNPFVARDEGVRFYAGAPLRVPEGVQLGTMCVVDTRPRQFSAHERAQLKELAALTVDALLLRRSEERFRVLLESGSDFLSILDASGHIVYQSPSVTPQLGYEVEELIGVPLRKFIHPDDFQKVSDGFDYLLENDENTEYQIFRFRHKDGSWRTLELRARNLMHDPKIGGIIAQTRDITERLRTERALRQSEVRLQAAFEQSALGEALVAQNGRWLRVNTALCEMLGYSETELLATDFQHLTHPDDLNSDLKLLEQVLAGEIPSYSMEKRYFCKDGEVLWAVLNVSLVHVGEGGEDYFISQIQNITSRKQQEERLRLLESVAINATDAILITEAEPVNVDGPRILYANQAFTRMTGYELDEVVGKTPRILQGPDTSRETRDYVATRLKKWKPVTVELLNYRKDNTPFWVELSISPVADETGWFTHWVSLQRDITARKESEVALEKARTEAETSRDEAERANRAKSEFLSRMSHELRTPLNAILGFGQLLEYSDLSSSDHQSVEQILKAGRHLLDLINEVLDISRIETGKLALSLEPVSIAELGREVIDLVRPLALQNGISLQEAQLFESEALVMADRRRLKQILINLVSNAVKYNRPGGTVLLWLDANMGMSQSHLPQSALFNVMPGLEPPKSNDSSRLRICVTDSGVGIPPDKQARLFMPFERLGADLTPIEGSGIGLAISKRLSEAMGGTLGVRSLEGWGSSFWVELPRALHPLDALENEDSSSLASHTPVSTRWVVLYIEDNIPNLQLMQGILAQRPSIRLLTALQGPIGLELARQHRPDVILLDLHLPEMNGEDVLRRLREDELTRDIPVIVISADATPRQIERIKKSGISAYLAKPFDVGQFLQALDAILMGR